MKHSSWALWCMSASSSRVGRRSPENSTSGRSVTVSIASRPSAFLPIVPTAHIDIVGVANSESAGDLCVAGPTGYGVRLLVDLAEGMC